jgi:hypothetical protein
VDRRSAARDDGGEICPDYVNKYVNDHQLVGRARSDDHIP